MFKRRHLFKLVNFWPPFLGAGIRVKNISSDFLTINVEMKLHFWNQNYIGTQFGGSLYAMCDPFYMLILLENLGRDYIVLDKGATIRFKNLGKSKVHATFHISKQQVEQIRQEANNNYKVEPQFSVQVFDEQGTIVAEVDKTIYVRRKDKIPRPKP